MQRSYSEKTLQKITANRHTISGNVSGRDFQERLEGEFNTSVGRLKPLMGKIQKTDELIDQIVYQLYGLTEEDITIVESKK